MNKTSLLEVDFDHLAWEPVDPQFASSLPGIIKPIKMARGKSEVYLNVKLDTSTPEKENEYKRFEKAFEEIDLKRKDKVSDKFLSAIGTNEEEDVSGKIPDEVDYDELLASIGDEEFDGENETVDEDNLPEDYSSEKSSTETYEPKEKYNFYVVNFEEKTIDSGWNDEESAKQRLAEIEENGVENYTVQPYGVKLFTRVGDPTTEKWKTVGLYNFYVINTTKNTVDSGWDNRAEANKRLKEVEALIERHNRLHAPEEGEGEDVDTISESDLAINDSYSIELGTEAIKSFGYSITHDEIQEPIEEYIQAVEKQIKNILNEAILTELHEPLKLDSFYLTFGFNKDYNPEDDSARKGGSDEYYELEIYLKNLISLDGSVEISAKEFKRACDRAKVGGVYQSTIKTINHASEYLYNNLGFASKENVSKLGKGKQADYNPREGEIDNNPSPDIHSGYEVGGSRESNQYDVDFNEDYDKDNPEAARENREKFAEDIGLNYVKKAKERIYTILNDPKYVNNYKDYIDYADAVETYIDDNYHPDKAHLSAQFRSEIEEFLKASDDLKEAYDSIMGEVTPKNDKEKERLSKKGHIGNTPVIRTSMNSGSNVGVGLHTDDSVKEIKRKFDEIYKKYTKLDSTQRRKKANEEYKETYGEEVTDSLARVNREREAFAREQGGYKKQRESNRQDNKGLTKPSRKKD